MQIMYKGDLLEVPDRCLAPRIDDGVISLQPKRIHGTKAEKQYPNSKRDKWRPESRLPRLQVSKCNRNTREMARSLKGQARLDWLMG
jgi:hypothetical protein